MDTKTISAVKSYIIATDATDVSKEGLRTFVKKRTRMNEERYLENKTEIHKIAREFSAQKKAGELEEKKASPVKKASPKKKATKKDEVDKFTADLEKVAKLEQRKLDALLKNEEEKAERVRIAKERHARLEEEKEIAKQAELVKKQLRRQEVANTVVEDTGVKEYEEVVDQFKGKEIEQAEVVSRLIFAKAVYGAEYDKATENWLKQHLSR
jgi:hypothetical protein